MCMVSNIGSGYKENFPYTWPGQSPEPFKPLVPQVGSQEFDKLRQEVVELRKLILAAKDFDKATGQPDCEMDEKVDLLRKLGKYLGVDLESVLK